jgi:hypothetical protein
VSFAVRLFTSFFVGSAVFIAEDLAGFFSDIAGIPGNRSESLSSKRVCDGFLALGLCLKFPFWRTEASKWEDGSGMLAHVKLLGVFTFRKVAAAMDHLVLVHKMCQKVGRLSTANGKSNLMPDTAFLN